MIIILEYLLTPSHLILKSGWILLSPRFCLYPLPPKHNTHPSPSEHCWQPTSTRVPSLITLPILVTSVGLTTSNLSAAVTVWWGVQSGLLCKSISVSGLFRNAAGWPVYLRAPGPAERNRKEDFGTNRPSNLP